MFNKIISPLSITKNKNFNVINEEGESDGFNELEFEKKVEWINRGGESTEPKQARATELKDF